MSEIRQSPCANCAKRPGTVIWSDGVMAWAHGDYQMLCRACVLQKQLDHARERAAAIPQLERDLAAAEEEYAAASKEQP